MSLTGRLVKCRLRWAGHLMRMGEERMAKRADSMREQGRRKRDRPQLRGEDCVRRDIIKMGMVGEWRELAEDRGKWTSIMVKAGQKLGVIITHTSPLIKGRGGEEEGAGRELEKPRCSEKGRCGLGDPLAFCMQLRAWK